MQRLVGVDVTRGVAVLGMVVAHVGAVEDRLWSPTGLLQLADGRSAATFATLAGVSVALLSGGQHPPADLRPARVRIAVRAVLIGLLGVVLTALGTPIAVILPTYAVLLVLLLPALGRHPRVLLGLATVPLLLGPPVVLAASGRDLDPLTALAVGPYYPAVVWLTYPLVGLAIGRLDLRSRRVRRTLLATGGGAALLGYGAGLAAQRLLGPDQAWWRALASVHPHTSMAPEVVGNLGVVAVVLAGALAAADRWPRATAPLAATGALALSAYTGHLLVIAWLGDEVVWQPDNRVLAAFLVGIAAGCWAWRVRWGRGPLERLVHSASAAAAR